MSLEERGIVDWAGALERSLIAADVRPDQARAAAEEWRKVERENATARSAGRWPQRRRRSWWFRK